MALRARYGLKALAVVLIVAIVPFGLVGLAVLYARRSALRKKEAEREGS
jgi:hypothetical protein